MLLFYEFKTILRKKIVLNSRVVQKLYDIC